MNHAQKSEYIRALHNEIIRHENFDREESSQMITYYMVSVGDHIYCTSANNQIQDIDSSFPEDDNVKIYILFYEITGDVKVNNIAFYLTWDLILDCKNYILTMADYLKE